jgi:hypothetical protein
LYARNSRFLVGDRMGVRIAEPERASLFVANLGIMVDFRCIFAYALFHFEAVVKFRVAE